MQPEWPGNQQPVAASETKPASRLPLVIGLVVLIAGLLATLVFVMTGGDDTAGTNSPASYVITQAAASEPTFEPKSAEGDDPFFPFQVQLIGLEKQTGVAVTADAIESGLYGGTVENTCDPKRLIDYLYNNPAKGQAWAAVQGIAFDQVGSYIRSLDARVLSAAATVVNHGFDSSSGAPIAVETTLEAGTAVLVDAEGDIRTRCYCGNPVKPMPPVFREPRCLVSPALVYTQAGSNQLQAGAPAQVELTGRIATSDTSGWTEIIWGDAATETGWTTTENVLPTLCTPVSQPGPSTTPVVSPAPSTEPTPTATPRPAATATVAPAPQPTVAPPPQATVAPAPQPTVAPPPPAASPTPTAAIEPEPTPTSTTCPDVDGDGICNAEDNCRDVPNPDQADVDRDAEGNACDTCTDIDDDLHCAETDDTCPNDYDPALVDTDRDGLGDVCDNCPTVTNPNQADTNGNGIGNACEEGEGQTGGCSPGSYFGLTRSSAESTANINECSWRIRRVDDKHFIGTADFNPSRLNFEIDNNIVTNVTLG